mmetsp:Transcript_77486/g.250794  ORF Transcript_77486/g.250794 Transcript_77486/m.250794 type:complete len:456 (-) Transcript_77486:813-2180(-)
MQHGGARTRRRAPPLRGAPPRARAGRRRRPPLGSRPRRGAGSRREPRGALGGRARAGRRRCPPLGSRPRRGARSRREPRGALGGRAGRQPGPRLRPRRIAAGRRRRRSGARELPASLPGGRRRGAAREGAGAWPGHGATAPRGPPPRQRRRERPRGAAEGAVVALREAPGRSPPSAPGADVAPGEFRKRGRARLRPRQLSAGELLPRAQRARGDAAADGATDGHARGGPAGTREQHVAAHCGDGVEDHLRADASRRRADACSASPRDSSERTQRVGSCDFQEGAHAARRRRRRDHRLVQCELEVEGVALPLRQSAGAGRRRARCHGAPQRRRRAPGPDDGGLLRRLRADAEVGPAHRPGRRPRPRQPLRGRPAHRHLLRRLPRHTPARGCGGPGRRLQPRLLLAPRARVGRGAGGRRETRRLALRVSLGRRGARQPLALGPRGQRPGPRGAEGAG